MGISRSASKQPGQPSERDQFWLDHEAALAESGQTAKEYAVAQDLSLQALYQARKRLRSLGLLAPVRKGSTLSRKRSRGKSVSFSKITVAPIVTDPRFRLELPSGMALEWAGGDVPESVVVLLERLVRPA
jgi:hypothetical protein